MGDTLTARHDDRHEGREPPVLGGIDHVEWWVGNARAFSGFLAAAFGFEIVAYAGPETGRRDRVSHVLQ
ncbi:MAG: 4-hydroxyphenylpyruvate dioxygenase, partial [Acidimicrobiales bacterium]